MVRKPLSILPQHVEDVLGQVGVSKGDHLFVHSSLMSFGVPEHGVATYLDPLLSCVGPEGTVSAPTFTFDFIQTGFYDAEETPSKGMGALAEGIRRHPFALRTQHPIQSIAAIGAAALALTDTVTSSAYGQASAFDLLTTLDFKVLLLGASPKHISLSHLSEERAMVPYRHYKQVDGTARLSKHGEFITGSWHFYARYLDVPIYPAREDEIIKSLLATGHWKRAVLNGVTVFAGSASQFCAAIEARLAADPYWLLLDPEPAKAFCSGLQR